MFSKKGISSPLMYTIFGSLLAVGVVIILLHAGYSFANSINNPHKAADVFEDVMYEVARDISIGSGRNAVISLDKETALIGVNPYSNFQFITNSIVPNTPASALNIARGSQCPNDEACLCVCEGFETEDSETNVPCIGDDCKIVCNELTCRPLPGIRFKEKSFATDVFDDKPNKIPEDRSTYYYNNSIIILHSDEIGSEDVYNQIKGSGTVTVQSTGSTAVVVNNNLKGVPYSIAGYRDYKTSTPESVFIRKAAQTDAYAVLTLCFKNDCAGRITGTEKCSIKSCNEIQTENICLNPGYLAGCHTLDCEWDYDKCIRNTAQVICPIGSCEQIIDEYICENPEQFEGCNNLFCEWKTDKCITKGN